MSIRNKQIVLKASADQKRVIKQAAQLRGMSMSRFAVETAVGVATDIALDQRIFTVSAEQHEAFMAKALDKERNSAALQRALGYKGSWERS